MNATDLEAAQREIVEEFSFFDDWMDRYQHLIDLGRDLPRLDEADLTEENRIHGCQSQVWIRVRGDAEQMAFLANSDSAIVSGLIALLLRVYSGRSAEDILAADPHFIRDIGLAEHLSPTRSNGLHAMLERIRAEAAAMVAGNS